MRGSGVVVATLALVLAGCGTPSAPDARAEAEAARDQVIDEMTSLAADLADHLGAEDVSATGEWQASWDPKFNRGDVSYWARASFTLPPDTDKPVSFSIADFLEDRGLEPDVTIGTNGSGTAVSARIDDLFLNVDEYWTSGPDQIDLRLRSSRVRAPSEVVDEFSESLIEPETLLTETEEQP